ncbi:hypothetical protein NQ314_012421 [Rhamnusium bicolor]|uniref:Nuclease HARBI1 n=1 Tax=Rhamnusium bicolor TaxID=1586634 RepID=A0AAV8XCL7_9CUCU|nr:hypothetical protein NQ314_012421 [Rhamnusium bicolor]
MSVLVALRFFASGSYQMDVKSNYFLSVSQASVNRCIREVTEALNHPDIFNTWVKFPNNFEELNAVRRRYNYIYLYFIFSGTPFTDLK